MRRSFNFLIVCTMIIFAGYTFETKRRAEIAEAHVGSLRAEIKREKEAIDILKADWSLLTQPRRLQVLTKRYEHKLGLQPLGVEQIVTLAEIPEKPAVYTQNDDTQLLGGLIDTLTPQKEGGFE